VLRFSIGSAEVRLVKELTDWRFPADRLFPAISTEQLAEAASTWGVHLADLDSGELVLDVNCYLIVVGGTTILVDAGNGNGKFRPLLSAHHMHETDFLSRLGEAGVRPTDVDLVLATHLHQDHCGWNTALSQGRWEPTFPNATYLFAQAELEHVSSFGRTAPVDSVEYDFYRTFEDSVLPVLLSGQSLTFVQSRILYDGHDVRIWGEKVGGHTPGHVLVHVEGVGGRALISGDAIHHPLQLADLGLVQYGDVDPRRAAAVRRRVVSDCERDGTILCTAHFPAPGTVTLLRENRYGYEWLKA
jgi:glyoxylase-like metal-dependent hydrolase (beta-lactamase superfamily II)